jgi:hypothetical protein
LGDGASKTGFRHGCRASPPWFVASKLGSVRTPDKAQPVARCRYGCNHIALRVNWRHAIDLGSIGDGAGTHGE